MSQNKWLDGMIGLVVGDALGIPVQFYHRNEIKNREQGPVTGMEGYGTFNMPKGTWSDDSSLALATLISIKEKREIDAKDIMDRFVEWETEGKYTPFGYAFDQGNTCLIAINNYMRDPEKNPNKCGKTGEYANGNGALMRILPACLYYYHCQQKGMSDEEAINGIHLIGGLTHNHLRSQICCGFYYFMVKAILDSDNTAKLFDLLKKGTEDAIKYYGQSIENRVQLSYLGRLFELEELRSTPEDLINGSGYVVESIEAAVWSLITTDSFEEALLKAVNLGDDTDTVAAIAGGLAGLYYGYEKMPESWLEVIKRREWIEKLAGEIFGQSPVA